MNNAYDVLMNYNQKEIYSFYEWSINDEITHIKKIPIYKVSDSILVDILNYRIKIDKLILEKIFNKTEVYKSSKIDYIPYSLILGNNYQCLSICFDKEGNEISRSDLIIDEKEEIIELLNNMKETEILIIKRNKISKKNYDTRYENNNIDIIKNELKKSYKNNDIGKLKYIYYELYGIYEHDKSKIYSDIAKDLNKGWSKKFENIIKTLEIINIRKQI